MTSYEFEVACKNAIIDIYKDKNVDIDIQNVHTVSLNRVLGSYKGTFIKLPKASECLGVDGKYFEITYNGDKKEMYVDVYQKISNSVIKEFDTKVKQKEEGE